MVDLVLLLLYFAGGCTQRRDNRLFLPLNTRIWICSRAVIALWNSRWRSGSRHDSLLPYLGRLSQTTYPRQLSKSCDLRAGDYTCSWFPLELMPLLTIALPSSNPKGLLAGYYLTQGSATTFVAVLSLISSNVAGIPRRRLYLPCISSDIVFPFSKIALTKSVGNLIGPQIFQSNDSPQYPPAEITIIVCWGVCLILLVVIRQINVYRDNRKNKITNAPGYTKIENGEFLDMTDMENPVYLLASLADGRISMYSLGEGFEGQWGRKLV